MKAKRKKKRLQLSSFPPERPFGRAGNTICALILTLGFLIAPNFTVAQGVCTDQIAGKSRAQLEAELEICNKEIAEWTETLNKTKNDSASFARDIAALTAKINAAQANIKSKNIAIANLSKDIAVKQSEISVLDTRITTGRKAIADILRKTNDINSYSLIEAMLSDKNLSEFFVDIDTYASTEQALADLFIELRTVRALTESEKVVLNKKREAEAAARAALETAKKQVEISQAEKKTLLAINKTKEKTYEQVLADRQAKAAQIRAVLFPLRDAGAIPFGTALQYAQAASEKTGVEPALILAILRQESNLGANVGSCLLTDTSTGNGRGANTGSSQIRVMNPTRDVPIFLNITKKLGRDPYNTKISCWIPYYDSKGNPFGWGGAMGPAQFIASTWNLMEEKVSEALNKSTPDPWNPPDAITAMAFFLKDIMGTTGDSFTDQRTAACRYYSGQTCYVNGRPSKGLSYGKSVMSIVGDIQDDIDFLQNV